MESSSVPAHKTLCQWCGGCYTKRGITRHMNKCGKNPAVAAGAERDTEAAPSLPSFSPASPRVSEAARLSTSSPASETPGALTPPADPAPPSGAGDTSTLSGSVVIVREVYRRLGDITRELQDVKRAVGVPERPRYIPRGCSFVALAGTPQWYDARQTFIGASEWWSVVAPPDMGGDIWGVYGRKTGRLPGLKDNDRMLLGRRLESGIIEAYEEKHRMTLRPGGYTIRRKDSEWAAFTPDAWHGAIEGHEGTAPAEIKLSWYTQGWRDGAVPERIQAQLQAQMYVSGAKWAILIAAVGELRVQVVVRSDEFIAWAVPRLEAFWECVKNDTRPEVDWSDNCRRVLQQLIPAPEEKAEPQYLDADEIEWALIEGYRAEAEANKRKYDEAMNRYRQILADTGNNAIRVGGEVVRKADKRGILRRV